MKNRNRAVTSLETPLCTPRGEERNGRSGENQRPGEAVYVIRNGVGLDTPHGHERLFLGVGGLEGVAEGDAADFRRNDAVLAPLGLENRQRADSRQCGRLAGGARLGNQGAKRLAEYAAVKGEVDTAIVDAQAPVAGGE